MGEVGRYFKIPCIGKNVGPRGERRGVGQRLKKIIALATSSKVTAAGVPVLLTEMC